MIIVFGACTVDARRLINRRSAYTDNRFYHKNGCVTPDAWLQCIASENKEEDARLLECWDEIFAKGACYAEVRSHQIWALNASSEQRVPASMTATEPKAPRDGIATSSVLSHLIRALRTFGGMVRSDAPTPGWLESLACVCARCTAD